MPTVAEEKTAVRAAVTYRKPRLPKVEVEKKPKKKKPTPKNQIKDVQPIRSNEQLENMRWALKRFCKPRDYILFQMGVMSGLRVGDLVKLKVEDVKGKTRVVIKEGKTGKPRVIILTNVYDELNRYISTLTSEWLFPSQKGGAVTPTQTYKQLNKAADAVGIESVGNHTLRKTFGYHYYQKTKNVGRLQLHLNHSTPAVTLRYCGITQAELEQDLEDFLI